MKRINMMLAMGIFLLLYVLPLTAEELLKWQMLEKLPDGRTYNYSPNSVTTIDAFTKEVYDGVVDSNTKDVRQLRIDCVQKKWAIGETKSWRNGEPVDSPNLSKDGWVWHPIDGNLNEKLVEAVCGK